MAMLSTVNVRAQVPPGAVEELQIAVGHFQAARYQEALGVLGPLERKYPDSAEIQQLHAIVLDLSGQPEAANQRFARAVELAPESVVLRSNYATSLMRLGQTEAAIREFKEVLARNPSQATANFNLGTILMHEESPQAARPYLERAFETQPELYENGYQLAFCAFLLDDHAATAAVLDRLGPVAKERVEFHLLRALNDQALGRENRVGELLTEIRPTLQGQPALRRQVVLLLMSRQLFREALPLLEAAAREHPASTSAWVELARARFALGQNELALQHAQKALDLRETGEAHALMGDILEQSEQPLEAVQHFQRAVELEPSERHLFALGYEFLSHWNWETAQQVFERGLEPFPQSWRLWLGLGAAQLGQNENENAARAFLEAIKISPQPLAYHLLSVTFDEAGQQREAVRAAFESYYASNPDDPWARYYRALTIFRTNSGESETVGHLQQTLNELAETAAQHPDFFEALYLLGEAYSDQQDWPRAVAALEKAVAARPDDVQARYKLGLALQRLGRTEEAKLQLEQYQNLKQQLDQVMNERMSATKRFIIELKQP